MGIREYFKNRKEKKQAKRAKMSKTEKVLRFISGTVIYVLFILALVFGIPQGLGYLLNSEYPIAAITSSSMWPELKKGDLVLIQGVDPRQVEVGDVVVFANSRGTFTIHRVIRLGPDTLSTKGDANNVEDAPITYESVVGKLYRIHGWDFRIPKIGFISTSFSDLNQ